MSWLSDRRVMWPSGFICFLFFCTGLLLVVQFIFRSWDPPPSPMQFCLTFLLGQLGSKQARPGCYP